MSQFDTVTLAGGCFWCTEAVFNRLKGVISVVSGYAASQVANPSYEAVCSGRTGAAEAIQISYAVFCLKKKKRNIYFCCFGLHLLLTMISNLSLFTDILESIVKRYTMNNQK